MKFKSIFTVLLLLIAVDVSASRDRGFFIGFGAGLLDVGVSDAFDSGVQYKTADFHLGYKYANWLGVDLRIGRGLVSETYVGGVSLETGRDFSVDSSITSFTSYYYRAEWAGEIAKLYVLLGGSNVESKYNAEGFTPGSGSSRGTSYGVGFAFWVNKRWDITVEAKQLIDTDTDSFALFSGNLEYRF